MSKLRKVFFTVGVAVLLVFAIIWSARDKLMMKQLSGLFAFFVSGFVTPADLYQPRVRTPIDVSQSNTMRCEFSTKYPGRYFAGVYVGRLDAERFYGARNRFSLQMQMTITSKAGVVFTRTLGPDVSPFIGKDGSGFILSAFDVPTDVPISKSLACAVEVVIPDGALAVNHGPIEFFITKASDK